MKRSKGVHRRSGSRFWHWHIKPPKDLGHLYKCGWACRCSLATEDLTEANRKAAALEHEWLERFATQRRQLHPERIEALTPELLHFICGRIRHDVLSADAAMRWDDTRLFALCEALEEICPTTHFADLPPAHRDSSRPISERKPLMLARLHDLQTTVQTIAATTLWAGNSTQARKFADTATRAHGFLIDWGRADNRLHLQTVMCATVEAWTDALARHEGKPVPTPVAPQMPVAVGATAPAKAHTIWDAFGAWKALEIERNTKTVNKFEHSCRWFQDAMPDRSLESLTHADGDMIVTALKAWAHEEDRSATTADNIRQCIATILAVAVRKGMCGVNPLQGTAIKRDKSKREPWTLQELQHLFDHPLFTAYTLPRTVKAGLDAAYWLPLLSLFSGGTQQ